MSSPPKQSPPPQYRHNSPDIDEQLRSLVQLLEHYQQDYDHLEQQSSDMVTDTTIISEFIANVNSNPDNHLHILYQVVKGMRKMLVDIFGKALILLPEVAREMGEIRAKIGGMQDQIDDNLLVIEGLKESKETVEKHLSEITIMYEKSRNDNLDLNDKMNIKQQEFESESRQIRKTFLEVTESSEFQKKILEQMYESHEKLTISVKQLQKDKSTLEAEVHKLNNKLEKSTIKISTLESEIRRKEDKLRQYQNQLQQMHQSRNQNIYQLPSRKGSDEKQYDHEVRQSFNQIHEDQLKKSDKTKLNEQLGNYQMPSTKQLNGSFIGSAIKRSIGQQSDYYTSQYEDTPSQKPNSHNNNKIAVNSSMVSLDQPKTSGTESNPFSKNKDITDPYFSHYILLSQSVKIKEDSQDMLNIDMKPYYQEVIDKRIPMHLWDQWVKNRLRELLRQSYGVAEV